MTQIFSHQLPDILFRWPGLIRPFWLWNDVVQLRNWHVWPVLKKHLAALPDGSVVLDAGCGEGHFLLRAAARFRRLRFIGLDRSAANLRFCEIYGKSFRINGLELVQASLGEENGQQSIVKNSEFRIPNSEFILLVGVLQYIENDVAALHFLQKKLAPQSGRLLIYCPVNGRFALKIYEKMLATMPNYETGQARCRIYQPDELLEKLAAAGLEIETMKWTFGPAGILSHDIYDGLLLVFLNKNWVWKLLAAASLAVVFPLILGLKVVDYFRKHESGNGLLLICKSR